MTSPSPTTESWLRRRASIRPPIRRCGSSISPPAPPRAIAAPACTTTPWPGHCWRRASKCCWCPTYTPLRTDEENVSLPRVFFGGVNVYLQQRFALFRHTPWFIDRLVRFSQSDRLAFALQRRNGSGKIGSADRLHAGRRTRAATQRNREADSLAGNRRQARKWSTFPTRC